MLLWVPGKLPGWNELLNEKGRTRNGWNGYNALKGEWAEQVALRARQQQFECQEGGYFTYLFVENHDRRDPSNVLGFVKLLEDALVELEVLGDDDRNHVWEIRPYVVTRPGPAGVLLNVDQELLGPRTESWMLEALLKSQYRKL